MIGLASARVHAKTIAASTSAATTEARRTTKSRITAPLPAHGAHHSRVPKTRTTSRASLTEAPRSVKAGRRCTLAASTTRLRCLAGSSSESASLASPSLALPRGSRHSRGVARFPPRPPTNDVTIGSPSRSAIACSGAEMRSCVWLVVPTAGIASPVNQRTPPVAPCQWIVTTLGTAWRPAARRRRQSRAGSRERLVPELVRGPRSRRAGGVAPPHAGRRSPCVLGLSSKPTSCA